MKKFYLLLSFFLICSISFGQEVTKRSKLTANTVAELQDIRPFKAKRVDAATNREYMEAFIRINDHSVLDSLQQLGVEIRAVAKTVITASIPVDQIDQVTELYNVLVIQAAQKVYQQMDQARQATNVNDIYQVKAPLTSPFLGKGVVVGVVDGGMLYGHRAFYNEAGDELRLKRVWNQTATGTPPDGFTHGAEYKTQEEILAAGSDGTGGIHATHVTNIAAGVGRSIGIPYYGVASEADIVFTYFGGTFNDLDTNVPAGLKYIFDYAESEGMPAVVNMSLGSYMGPHDGSSLRDIMMDELQGEGRILVGAIGNNGFNETHIYKQFTEEDNVLRAAVNMDYTPLVGNLGYYDAWGTADSDFEFAFCVYNKTTGYIRYQTRYVNASTEMEEALIFPLSRNIHGVTGTATVITERSPLNNRPHADFDIKITDWPDELAVGFLIRGEPGTEVNVWADRGANNTFTDHGMEIFDSPDNLCTLLEVGGTGNRLVTVGAYSTKNKVETPTGKVLFDLDYELYDIAPFSSRGPSADGRMKPDITAPGSVIVSAYTASGDNLIGTYDDAYYCYGAEQGTSMAAPHVTGVIATWLQALPTLTPEDVKEVLAETAIRDEYVEAGSMHEWGHGKIDAYAGLIKCLKLDTIPDRLGDEYRDSLPDEVIMYQSKDQIKLTFAKSFTTIQFSVYSSNGQLIQTEFVNQLAPGEEYPLYIRDYASGLYLLKIKTDSGTQTLRFIK